MKINIIIGFTPYHAYVVDNIISCIKGDSYCFFSKTWPKKTSRYKKIGFSCGNVFFRKFSNVISLVWLSIFFRFFTKNKEIDLYIPHPLNIATNYLFFSEKIKVINIYEDGLLNYYDAKAENRAISSKLKFFGKIIGLPFRAFSGHLSGCDERNINALWVSNPALVVSKKRFKHIFKVDFKRNKIFPCENTILFLDQDTSVFLSEHQRCNMIEKMKMLYPLCRYKYIYKRHHDFVSSISFMDEININLARLPAEEIVSIIKPSIIVSFFSTALFNISIMHPNIKCIALASEFIDFTRDGEACHLSDLFEGVGVKNGL